MHPVSGDISSMSLLAWCLLSPPGSKNCIGFENVDKLALQFPIPHFDQFCFATALINAGVLKDVIQVLHLSPSLTSYVVQHSVVDFVSFTGSIVGGQAVERAAVEAPGFKGVALEV